MVLDLLGIVSLGFIVPGYLVSKMVILRDRVEALRKQNSELCCRIARECPLKERCTDEQMATFTKGSPQGSSPE